MKSRNETRCALVLQVFQVKIIRLFEEVAGVLPCVELKSNDHLRRWRRTIPETKLQSTNFVCGNKRKILTREVHGWTYRIALVGRAQSCSSQQLVDVINLSGRCLSREQRI